MSGPNDLAAIRIVARLQTARAEAARGEVGAAQAALDDAARRTAVADAGCEEALACWHGTLADRRPDPHRLAAIGNWVAERGSALTAARLDEAMAGRHRDAMAHACAEKMALRDVATALHERLRRRSDRSRDERAAQAAGDRHLMKRRWA